MPPMPEDDSPRVPGLRRQAAHVRRNTYGLSHSPDNSWVSHTDLCRSNRRNHSVTVSATQRFQ